MELVGVEPLIEHDTSSGQPMVGVILVVRVAEFVCRNAFSSKPVILGFDIAASVL